MSRLTKVYGNGNITLDASQFPPIDQNILDSEINNSEPVKAAVAKLAEIEDAEENGLLPRLPCKVGDTVWVVNDLIRYSPDITKGEAVAIYLTDDSKDKTRSHVNVRINKNRFTRRIRIAEFGKTVFLTPEEAMQALKARDSKGECK